MSDDPKIGDTITIAGIEATLASAAECEQAAMVVCGNVSFFPDDVRASCSRCGDAIVHRPYVPKTPPKVCTPCAVRLLRDLP